VVCCLIKFDSPDLRQMPRIYLATAAEIAEKLHEITDYFGGPALCEEYQVVDIYGARRIQSLPEKWRFSQPRIAELMRSPDAEKPLRFRFSASAVCAEANAAPLNCGPMVN